MPKKNKQKNIRRRKIAEAARSTPAMFHNPEMIHVIEDSMRKSFLDPMPKCSPNLILLGDKDPSIHLDVLHSSRLDVLGDLHVGLMTESPKCSPFADKSIRELIQNMFNPQSKINPKVYVTDKDCDILKVDGYVHVISGDPTMDFGMILESVTGDNYDDTGNRDKLLKYGITFAHGRRLIDLEDANVLGIFAQYLIDNGVSYVHFEWDARDIDLGRVALMAGEYQERM